MAPTTESDQVTLASFQDPTVDVESLLFPDLLRRRAPDDVPLSRGELESLVSHLTMVQTQLREVHRSAEQQLSHARLDMEEQRGLMLEAHAKLQQQWASATSLLQEAQAKSLLLTQVATKRGNRLQTALVEKDRATAAIRQLNHLATFAHAPSIAALPALFHDEARQGEAAAIAKTLLRLTQNVVDTMRSSHGTLGPAQQGSVQAAMERLEQYCDGLDKAVVARFDAALARADYSSMAACARVMAAGAKGSEAPGAAEKLLVQRYISTRPMFTDPDAGRALLGDDGPGSTLVGATPGAQAAPASTNSPSDALRVLKLTYKSLLQCVIAEAAVLDQVFASPGDAAAALVSRVFEQRVQGAVHSVLSVQGVETTQDDAASLRARLVLLQGVVRLTRKLGGDLQEVLGGQATLLNELADSATAPYTACYLEDELDWLGIRFEEAAASVTLQSLEPFVDLLAAHAEALDRAVDLAPGPALPETVRALVGTDAAAGGGDASANGTAPASEVPPPTLLGQCGGFLERGLRASAAALPPALAATATLAAAMELLRAHVAARVLPHVAASPGDAHACFAACSALQARLDAAVTSALRAALSAETRVLARELLARQEAAEFDPEGAERRAAAAAASYWGPAVPTHGPGASTTGAQAPGERPTPACVHACARLRGLSHAVSAHLHGLNATSAAAALGREIVTLLTAHRAQFRFSPLGTVAWRRDLQEYRQTLAAIPGMDRAVEEIEALQADCALLLVDPEVLPGVVQAAGGAGGRDRALEVVRLRTDWDPAEPRWRALLNC